MARIGKEQLERLQKKYKTDAAIARIYGLTRQAVYQLRKQYGLKPSSDKSSDRNREVKRLRSMGISAKMLSVKFRLSTTHIYRILNDRV